MLNRSIAKTRAEIDTARENASNPVVVRTLTIALWLAVLTQKIALPGNIEITVAIGWATLLYLFARRMAMLSLARVCVFAILFGTIVVTQLLYNGSFSLTAVMFVIPLYALFNFFIPMSTRDYVLLLRNYQDIGVFVAGLVILQWGVQAVKLGTLNIEPYIPARFLYTAYNYLQPTSWGSAWLQPNAMLFLEASLLSQFLALALLIEVFLFQRVLRIGLLFVALVSTLAGTGILMVILTAPLAVQIINKKTLMMGLALIPFAIAFMVSFNVDEYFLQRTGEVQVEQSSGYGRFVEPYTILPRIYERNPVGSIVAGIGPGNIDMLPYINRTLVLNPISKLIAEYGWISALVWMLYIHAIMFRSKVPYFVLIPLLLQFNFMNGSLLMPIEVVYCVFLLAAPKLNRRMDHKSVMAMWQSIKNQPAPVRRPKYSMARIRSEAARR